MKICIAGAGVIGVTTAYALARRGHQVTVVDSCSKAAQGASFANGGQLSYSYVAPLADASVWKNLPGYLLAPHSPLSWRPKFDTAQWRWIARFLMACNAKSSARATAELLRLAFFSRDCLALLQRNLALDFGFRTAGKLVMLSTPSAVEAARRQVRLQASMGCEQEVLSTARCVEIEPALAAAAGRWSGGVYTPSEQVGDCAAFSEQLSDALARRAFDVRFAFDTTLTGAVLTQGRVTALRSSAGDIPADAFVLANGVGSMRLASQMGFEIPIYPLKGYSVTLKSGDRDGRIPSVSVTDLSKKMVYARIGDRLRVAGRVEIVGDDLRIDAQRCRALAGEAQRLFPGISSGQEDIRPWAGLRPATPTGMPIIGRGPISNVFINTGHGALGWTLACGSAELLAGAIEGRAAPFDISPFGYRA